MTDGQNTVPLSDVSPERARLENDAIDEQFNDYEEQVASLKDEKSQLEDELASLRDEKEALEDVVQQFKASRREDLIDDIQGLMAGAAVNEEDFQWDFAELEEADLDTVKTVKNAVETTVEAAGLTQQSQPVDNRDESPDLGGVDSGEDDDYEQAAQEAAEELGMGEAWQKVQAGEQLASPQKMDLGNDTNSSVEELASALQEVSGE